eukprot:582036-Prorocentrum_minimum.AAC.1
MDRTLMVMRVAPLRRRRRCRGERAQYSCVHCWRSSSVSPIGGASLLCCPSHTDAVARAEYSSKRSRPPARMRGFSPA